MGQVNALVQQYNTLPVFAVSGERVFYDVSCPIKTTDLDILFHK